LAGFDETGIGEDALGGCDGEGAVLVSTLAVNGAAPGESAGSRRTSPGAVAGLESHENTRTPPINRRAMIAVRAA
jgi:hypothetical protein